MVNEKWVVGGTIWCVRVFRIWSNSYENFGIFYIQNMDTKEKLDIQCT